MKQAVRHLPRWRMASEIKSATIKFGDWIKPAKCDETVTSPSHSTTVLVSETVETASPHRHHHPCRHSCVNGGFP